MDPSYVFLLPLSAFGVDDREAVQNGAAHRDDAARVSVYQELSGAWNPLHHTILPSQTRPGPMHYEPQNPYGSTWLTANTLQV